jgi:hypothetical protein
MRLERVKIVVVVQQAEPPLDDKGCDQAVYGLADRDPSPSQGAIVLGALEGDLCAANSKVPICLAGFLRVALIQNTNSPGYLSGAGAVLPGAFVAA